MANTSKSFHDGEYDPTAIARLYFRANGQAWRRLAEALGDRFSLTAPDLIGCGASASWNGAHAFTPADEAALTKMSVHQIGRFRGGDKR